MTTIDRIQLTRDADLRTKLRRKRDEYATRLGHRAPETDPDSVYKMRILEALFERGFVEVPVLRERFAALSWHDDTAFNEAVAIIAAYNDNQLARLAGGTGLQYTPHSPAPYGAGLLLFCVTLLQCLRYDPH